MKIMSVVRCRWVALRFLFWAAVAVVPSCAGDATPGSRLSAMRVLGARTQVVADPTQSWPRPGEAFRVTWLVAGPAAPRPAGWAFRAHACATNQDAAACRAAGVAVPANVPGSDRGSSPGGLVSAPPAAAGDALPSLELTVPDAATVAARGLTKIIIDGVVCGGGSAGDLDAPAWSRCGGAPTDGQGPVDETDVETTVAIRLGEDGNQAPALGDDPFTWEGQPWTSGGADAPNAGGGAACAAQPEALLVPIDDRARTITVTTDDADRGTHPVMMPAAGKPDHQREELQLSAFTTAGSFETQFGAVSSADSSAAPSITVKWTPPEPKDAALPAEGRLVRFVFVLRDLRGGIDWTTRTICLTPNSQ